MAKAAEAKLETIQGTNGGVTTIEYSMPYTANIGVEGVAPLLFHRWSCESIDEKAKAAKGSKAKKTDDIESFVYRNEEGYICIPTEYLRMSIINAAKFKQDPRSPRKSAMDLFKAGIVGITDLCSLGSKDWDYLDKRRAMVQRNGITRSRPAFNAGWKCEFTIQCNLPEYINPALLNETAQAAGRLIGLADMRPTFGRFVVTKFEVQQD